MQQQSILQILDDWEFVIAPILFTAVALFTRLYKIGISNIVTWDEAQFVSPLTWAVADSPIDFWMQLRKVRQPLHQA